MSKYSFRFNYLEAIQNLPENETTIKEMCRNNFIKEKDRIYIDTGNNILEIVPGGYYIIKLTKHKFYIMPDNIFELLFIKGE